MWAGLRLFVTRRLEEEARWNAQEAQSGHEHRSAGSEGLAWRQRLTSVDAWTDVAQNFRGDWEMLWKEIGAGFLIAGFIALLPRSFFNGLFLTDAPAWIRIPENLIVGPLVAVLSFVCSIGNAPLAAVLWAGGISFSGVIAFIYADLLVIPILLIYRKYYGTKVAALLSSIMLASIILAALVVSGLFGLAGLIPSERPDVDSITERAIGWNYTTFLNIVFLGVAAVLIGLTLRRGVRDPVCGMTVSRKTALRSEWNGTTYYFCGPGCRERFEADPEQYLDGAPAHEHAPQQWPRRGGPGGSAARPEHRCSAGDDQGAGRLPGDGLRRGPGQPDRDGVGAGQAPVRDRGHRARGRRKPGISEAVGRRPRAAHPAWARLARAGAVRLRAGAAQPLRAPRGGAPQGPSRRPRAPVRRAPAGQRRPRPRRTPLSGQRLDVRCLRGTRSAERDDPLRPARRHGSQNRRPRAAQPVRARVPAGHEPALCIGERAGQARDRRASRACGLGRPHQAGCLLRLAALLAELPEARARGTLPRRDAPDRIPRAPLVRGRARVLARRPLRRALGPVPERPPRPEARRDRPRSRRACEGRDDRCTWVRPSARAGRRP